MALVLGMEVGQSIFIDKDKITLVDIKTPLRFMLKVESTCMDSVFEITASERAEIFPEVFVQAGKGGNMQVVKIAIEANPKKLILREKVLRRNEDSASQ